MFNKLFDKVQNIDMKDNIRWLLDYVQHIQEDTDKIKEFSDNMPAWYTLWKHLKDNETELFKTEICNLNLVDCNEVSADNQCNLELTPDSDKLPSLIHVFWALNLYQTSFYAAQILQFQSFDYRKNPWIMTTQREKLIEYLKIQSGSVSNDIDLYTLWHMFNHFYVSNEDNFGKIQSIGKLQR